MINFDDVTKQNIKEHNPSRPQIPDHPYRILIIGGSGSGRKNSLVVCFYHVTYAFQSESVLCICLNAKELLA